MKKREFEELKSRNASALKDIIAIEIGSENPTDKMEIVTEKEFGGYLSEADKIASKGSRNYIASNTVSQSQIEDAKRDVDTEIERTKGIYNELTNIAVEHHFAVENEEDNLVFQNEVKVSELYEELKNGLLTIEEFSDLVERTRQMSFNESLRNYVDMGRTVAMDRIQKLEKESGNKILMIFKPALTKFKEKLGIFEKTSLDGFERPREGVTYIDNVTQIEAKETEEKFNDIFESFFDGNLDEIIDANYTENDLEKMIKETEKLKAEYEEMRYDKAYKISYNGEDDYLYPIDVVEKRDNLWAKYIASLNETVKALQVNYLKQYYNEIEKYKVAETSSGNIICLQIGDEFLSISKDRDKFVDDLVLFHKKVQEYEKNKTNKAEDEFNIDDEFESFDLGQAVPIIEPLSSEEVKLSDDTTEEQEEKTDSLTADPLETIRNLSISVEKEENASLEPEKETEEKEISQEDDALERIKELEIPVGKSKEDVETITDPLASIRSIEIPIQKEENAENKSAEQKAEKEPIEKTTPIKIEAVTPTLENIPVVTEPAPTPEVVEPVKEQKETPEIVPVIEQPASTPEVIPVAEENTAEIASSKEAYIEFMSCFVSRDEAKELATDENIDVFESSNIGFNKYISEINTGKIAKDTSYETFIIDRLEKDNGLKYDEPTEELAPKKDDSGLDIIVSDQEPKNQKDLSGLDVFLTDDPVEFADDSGQFTPKTR